METVYRDYAPKGVQFFYLYKALTHPELHGYVKPISLEERLAHIKEAKRTLGTEIPWLADTMSNDLKHAIGNAPNSEFVIDPDGKIIVSRVWSRPSELRNDLAGLVGPVEKPTTVADLNLAVAEPPKPAPTGIVERVKMPSRMRGLVTDPRESRHPYYVKLRAEGDREFLRDGKGQMYLGFFLDPIYGVHWNNLVAPVKYEFFPGDGVVIDPAEGSGPELEVEADADPLEFLLNVDRGDSTEPVRMAFHYFACTDKMCIPVTQEYMVHWEADPDGGTPNRNRQGMRGRPRGAGGGRPGMDPGRMANRMMRADADGDGKISKQEAPEQMLRRFDRMDSDSDGYISRAEIEAGMQRARGGAGSMAARMMQSDADGDGKLSREEVPERMRERFDQMDADGDGFITQAELEAFTPGVGGNRRP